MMDPVKSILKNIGQGKVEILWYENFLSKNNYLKCMYLVCEVHIWPFLEVGGLEPFLYTLFKYKTYLKQFVLIIELEILNRDKNRFIVIIECIR